MMTNSLDEDYGAQPQRTILSWHRTVLAVTLGSLVASLTAQRQEHPIIAAVAALASFVLLVLVLGSLRQWGPFNSARWTVLLMTCVSVVVLGLIGLLLAVANLLP